MTQETYQARVPIFPRSVKGRFRFLKYAILFLAYGIYFSLPWIPWERSNAPDQIVLFDLVGRHFYIFDLVVYAQDIFWLAGFLVVGALLLFFVTGIAGRVFCGYFCFQTLWTDVFMWIERQVQGERNARIRLAEAPLSPAKAFKFLLTHLLWLCVALATGLTFTLYWGYAPDIVHQLITGTAPFPAYATTLFLTLTTYVMAGLAREQVCTYMCPYARFQGVMFDSDTLVVAYDDKRGEQECGRCKPARGLKDRDERHRKGYGDCIDCGYCVQVCPMGIDIRNGLQYQCTSCALCVDACDTIMDSINYPRGLIRYSSENALSGKPTRIFKLKNIGYGFATVLTIALLVWSITTRSLVEMAVRQIRQPISVTLADGREQNRYEIKINNKTSETVHYRFGLQGLDGAELALDGSTKLEIAPESSVQFVTLVRLSPRDVRESRSRFQFVLQPISEAVAEPESWDAVFYVPANRLTPIQ